MKDTTVSNSVETSALAPRSILDALAPIDRLAAKSASLIANHEAKFEMNHRTFVLPRYLFIGPKSGGEPIRVGLFSEIHGDGSEGVYALGRFIQLLEDQPDLGAGYCLFLYPICNPSGFEARTRNSLTGKDLNREFWKGSREPEVRLLESELVAHAFHGIISLHTDDASQGFYGFARGATLTKHLIEPALKAAAEFLPRNYDELIDGFPARNGIIRKGHDGMLSAPLGVRPRPFEIILESPAEPPTYLKEAALVAALRSILINYREFIAYAPNL
jgi:murein peptide amidase A